MTAALRAVKTVRASRLLHGSAWVLVGLGVQAVLGFAFWTLGSRVATAAELGRASALYTGIQFITYAGGLGLTVALARHATDPSDDADTIFGWAVVANVVSATIAALAFTVVVASDAVGLVTSSALSRVVFVVYAAGIAVGLLVDVRLMAARRWRWLVGRLAAIGLLRLVLVPLDVGVDPDAWLYHLMLGPLALGGFLAIPLLAWLDAGRFRLRRSPVVGPVARFALVNWVANLASQAPQFVLPLLVVAHVSASAYASFFLAWTMTALVFLVPGAIAQILLVEGSKTAGATSAEVPGVITGARQALTVSVVIAVVAWLGSFAGGQVLIWVFGEEYRALGRTLPALMAAAVAWAVTSVRLSEARIRRDQPATVAITLTLGLGILGPALVWVPADGVPGATRAWLLGNIAAAVVATIAHRRVRHAGVDGAAGAEAAISPAAR